MSFEKNLESLRKQKGWSQDDLADRLNLTRQAVSKWETGSSKPDIDNVKNISQLFSVKIDDLLNNEVVEDKAVSLNFEKKEKRENIIKTIKFAIIALVIVYLITVIYKFASLLIIVNGVQKYANLNNYHYVITTYDENGLKEKEECWFKDGVSKTVIIAYNDEKVDQKTTYIDYNNFYGFVEDAENEKKTEVDLKEYLKVYGNFDKGGQLFSKIPLKIRKVNTITLIESFFIYENNILKIDEDTINVGDNEIFIEMDKATFLPKLACVEDKNDDNKVIYIYDLEINGVDSIIM